MIFEQETVAFQILEVLFFDQYNIKKYSFERNFDALSFRLEADTVMEYGGKRLHFTDNSIGFFPADTDYTRIAKRDKMIVVHFKSFGYHASDIESFFPKDPEKYLTLFMRILDCWEKKEFAYKHESASILSLIFAELYRDNAKPHEGRKIAASIEYINENCFKKDFSLSLAAEKSFVSEPYFRKLFKNELGVSPKQYVINRRIKHAASLIIAGYYTLQEISELCGYNDYKHFSVEFKKALGVSPSRYGYNFVD